MAKVCDDERHDLEGPIPGTANARLFRDVLPRQDRDLNDLPSWGRIKVLGTAWWLGGSLGSRRAGCFFRRG